MTLGRSSRNSSQPPSADSPSAPPRRGKDSSGRKQGGQSGHEGKGRPLLPAWAVDEVVEHWRTDCVCGHVFCEANRVAVGQPARRQVEELPVMAVRVTEHRCHRARCPEWDHDVGLLRTFARRMCPHVLAIASGAREEHCAVWQALTARPFRASGAKSSRRSTRPARRSAPTSTDTTTGPTKGWPTERRARSRPPGRITTTTQSPRPDRQHQRGPREQHDLLKAFLRRGRRT
jgi:hypothetical protein